MNLFPEKEKFEKEIKQSSQLVWSEQKLDKQTAIQIADKLQEDNEYFFLLESDDQGKKGRYSVIGINPDLVWKADEKNAYISIDNGPYQKQEDDILTSCKKIVTQNRLTIPEGLPPMSSGLIGYLSYDSIRLKEDTVPNKNKSELNIPIGLFMRPQLMIIIDSKKSKIYTTTSCWNDNKEKIKTYDQAIEQIKRVNLKIKKSRDKTRDKIKLENNKITANMSHEKFCEMIEKAKDYIIEGDIFQVVPSQRFQRDFKTHPFIYYEALRKINPSPFMFYLDLKDFQLVGASPEILVRVKGDIVTIKPLAGTRKRGKNKSEDEKLAENLLSDKKEVSEHLMLVDLSRNDVGRVSKPGSVKVTKEMEIEYYSHVMHISSTVEGRIETNKDAIDALFSGLPVGTVSGAPKVRAMQIIDELEPTKRDFYAGCVGYFSANGSMETCITLRTALIKNSKIYIQAGCGVVAESNPEDEYNETINKAAALRLAIEEAEK